MIKQLVCYLNIKFYATTNQDFEKNTDRLMPHVFA